ncbi:MAG: amino acid ABC transporter permease [Gammaproteobacteria bacterium]
MDWALMAKYTPVLLDGLALTMIISVAGMSLALLMGAGLSLLRRSGNRFASGAARAYTEVILGIPILVLMYLLFFVLPEFDILISPLAAGLLTLMLYYAPYIAEVIRGALNAIPRGQIEAAQTIGMSRFQAMRRIVLPQAVGLMLPPLTGLSIGLIKDSAILSVISVHELAFQAKQVVSRTYAPLEVYLLVAVGYWVTTFVLESAMRKLEHRMTRHRTA